jgi:hypothetical protein
MKVFNDADLILEKSGLVEKQHANSKLFNHLLYYHHRFPVVLPLQLAAPPSFLLFPQSCSVHLVFLPFPFLQNICFTAGKHHDSNLQLLVIV